MKMVLVKMLVIAASLFSTLSLAYPCRPASGSPTQLLASPFDIKAPSDGSSPAGHVAAWDESGESSIVCSVGKPNQNLNGPKLYQFGFVSGVSTTVGPGGREYIDINDFLGLAFEVYIAGEYKDYINVTSAGQYTSNKQDSEIRTDSSGNHTSSNIGTGRKGRVFLWVKKPFIGVKEIPLQKVMWANAQLISDNGAPPTPYLEMSVLGIVRSDATCQFSEQVYAMDFGDLESSSITSMSQLDNNRVGKQLTLNVNCSQNVAKLPMTMSLIGSSVITEPNAFSTSHPHIGIAVKANNKLVQPLQDMTTIPSADQQIDTQTNGTQKSATIQAYPVKLDDKVAPGEFNATATLKVDFK